MSDAVKLARKISYKEIMDMGGKSTEEVKAWFLARAKSDNQFFGTIAGNVTGYGEKKTNFGDSVFLIGRFISRNDDTGEILESNKVYLDRDTSDNIVGVFRNRSEGTEYISFAVKVGVTVAPKSATGYAFICQPVTSPTEGNERAELMGRLGEAPKVLAAPAKAAAKK